jgi:hypothetical protein
VSGTPVAPSRVPRWEIREGDALDLLERIYDRGCACGSPESVALEDFLIAVGRIDGDDSGHELVSDTLEPA